jgi:VWFA-related protein
MRFLAIVLSASLTLGAQQSASPPPEPARSDAVFSVTSTLVQIDAVVLDGKGRQVTNLGPGDFEVLIDGRPQQITHFSYVRVTPEAAPVQPQEKGKLNRPQTPDAAAPPPKPEVQREQVRRTIVLVADDLNLSFESVAFMRRALHKFIEQQIQPGDLVAICRTASGTGALQTFTTDRRILLSVVDHLRWFPDWRQGLAPDMATRAVAEMLAARVSSQPLGTPKGIGTTVGTLMELQRVVDALRDLPGRKSVVVFSDGLYLWLPPTQGAAAPAHGTPGEDFSGSLDAADALKALTDRANRSGTVIYTINTTGLSSLTPDASFNIEAIMSGGPPHSDSPSAGDVLLNAGRAMTDAHNISQAGLATVAELTGGFTYTNGNDLNYGLERVLEDQKGYYLIGFHPDPQVFETSRGLRFNHIKVRVHGAGLHVRSRTGFYGETDEDARPKYQSPQELLRASMLSPFRSSDIHVRATPLYSQLTKEGPLVRNLIYIDVRDLEFEPQLDGSQKAHIDLLAVAVGAGDRPVGAVSKPYIVLVPNGGMERAMQRGVVYSLDLAVPNPGPYQFRMAVRDQKSGKVGSASHFLEIPDLKRARLALTSVVLGKEGISGENDRAARWTPARRLFQQEETLQYFCLIEHSGKPHAAAPGTIEARVRVFRDNKEIYSGPAPITKAETGETAVFGKLRLKGAIAPGEYFLQVSARSHEGKRETVAAQWTDFEVID